MVKNFLPFITELLGRHDGVFFEPFVGGFNVLPTIARYTREACCSDIHPGLVALYQAGVAGWSPPASLTPAEYAALRRARDWSDPLTSYAAFGLSWGGREFAGLVNASGRDYAAETRRSFLRKVPTMRSASFKTSDFRDVCPSNALIYCDPPYRATTGYGRAFDHHEFAIWCHERARAGCSILVSSIEPVPGFRPVWQGGRSVQIGRARRRVIERLSLLTYYGKTMYNARRTQPGV